MMMVGDKNRKQIAGWIELTSRVDMSLAGAKLALLKLHRRQKRS
jgi:hypothetical protein